MIFPYRIIDEPLKDVVLHRSKLRGFGAIPTARHKRQ